MDKLLGLLGFYDENRPSFLDTSGALNFLLHTGNVGDYALPISGGRLTGTLFTQDAGMEAEWVGHLRNRNGITYVGGTNADSTLYRVLAIISPNYSEVDEATALRYEYTSADGIKSDIILHTGNSNAVKIQSTAPTDTSALWVW
jgi:hypothetical protein